MKKIDSNDIPKGVKDDKAYIEWQKLTMATILNDSFKLMTTSDPFIEVDLCTPVHILLKKISKLPSKERKEIEIRAKEMKSIQGKVGALKKKAFGSIGNKSIYESMLETIGPELIGYFGKYLSVKEVHKIVVEDLGYPIPRSEITKFKQKNAKKINKSQGRYKGDLGGIRLGHRRSRLEELTSLNNLLKEKIDSTANPADIKLQLQVISQIKDEIDSDPNRDGQSLAGMSDTVISPEQRREILNDHLLDMIIISRVAYRQNKNPLILLDKLENSFYAKYSGFARPDEGQMNQPISYPSSMVYDWDKIEKLNRKPEGEADLEAPKERILSKADESKAMSLKDQLMARVRVKTIEADNIQSRIDNA